MWTKIYTLDGKEEQNNAQDLKCVKTEDNGVRIQHTKWVYQFQKKKNAKYISIYITPGSDEINDALILSALAHWMELVMLFQLTKWGRIL